MWPWALEAEVRPECEGWGSRKHRGSSDYTSCVARSLTGHRTVPAVARGGGPWPEGLPVTPHACPGEQWSEAGAQPHTRGPQCHALRPGPWGLIGSAVLRPRGRQLCVTGQQLPLPWPHPAPFQSRPPEAWPPPAVGHTGLSSRVPHWAGLAMWRLAAPSLWGPVADGSASSCCFLDVGAES